MVNNEVIGATITLNQGTSINNDNAFGNISGSNEEQTQILRQILEQMKKGNDETSKQNKMVGAGLIGLAASMGVNAATATGAGVGAFVNDVIGENKGNIKNQGDKYYYEKILYEGKETVLKINRQTQEIEEVITKRNASERNILDLEGNIHSSLQDHTGIFDKMTTGLATYKDMVILTAGNMIKIQGKTEQEVSLREQLNQLLIDQIQKIGGSVKSTSPSVKGVYDKDGNLVGYENANTKTSYASGSKSDTWQNSGEYDNTFGKSQNISNSQTSQSTNDYLTATKLQSIISGPQSKWTGVQTVIKTPR